MENTTLNKSIRHNEQESINIREIYRGVWADKLLDGQKLPVGSSIGRSDLSIKLELDFSTFDKQLNNFKKNLEEAYQQSEDAVKNWLLNEVGSKIDPYIFFICTEIQKKVEKLLGVEKNTITSSTERHNMYANQGQLKLSELKGKSACAERAALGQYIFQKIGVKSAYVSGVTINDIKDSDMPSSDHSFIVLQNPNKLDSTLIFDIARPRSMDNFSRILETNVPFTYNLLKDKKELFVESTEVLQGGKLWFGIGDSGYKNHRTIAKPKKTK